MANRIACTLSAAAFGLLIATAPALAGDDVSGAVKDLNTAWDSAFNSQDAEAVAKLYAEDARVITGDGEVIEGREAIQGLFQGFMDSGFKDHQIEMIDVEANGDIAYETATWKGVGGDGNEYGGKVVNVYEKQESGDWQAVLHIWN